MKILATVKRVTDPDMKIKIKKEQPDLVLLGKQAVDDDNNQVAQLPRRNSNSSA